MPAAPTRSERLAPWLAGLVLALPVLLTRYPPMADLPAHEAAVGLLRHWGDVRYVPPHVYTLNLGQPNQAFYYLILALAYVVPIGTASKLVVAATLVALPVAAAHLAAHLGVTRWAALLVAPVGLGWMFFWGLLANLMGLAAFLFALPALDRFVARPTLRRLGAVAAWMVALHFVHDLSALAAAIGLVVLTACAWRGWRDNALRLTPAVALVALAVLSRALEERQGRPGTGVMSFPTLASRVRTLPDSLFAGSGWVSGALLALALAPLALFALERRRGERETPPPQVAWAERFRFEILAGFFALLYFVLPGTLNWTADPWTGISQINQRFLPLGWSVLALAVAPRTAGGPSSRAARLPRVLACLLLLAPVLVTWPEFAASDRVYRDLDAVAEHMEPGSSHLLLELGPTEPDALFTATSAGGHLVAEIGGRALFDYTRSPTAPVIQRRGAHWDEVLERLEGHPYRFVAAHDLRRFRYVVLHTSDPGKGELVRLALEPEARTVFRHGDLTLLESTLPQAPLDSADDAFPPPPPHPESLDERVMTTAKRLGAELGSPRE